MIVGVIPARLGSTRLPSKPLKKILNKTMIEWVVEGSKTSRLLDKVVVATDHADIAQLAQRAGAEVVMTDSDIPTGTDRVWAAVKNLKAEVVLNIQGDEPLITADVLDPLIQAMVDNSLVEMGTLGHPIESEESLKSINTAKIVLNNQYEAIYFSRHPIPFSREKFCDAKKSVLQHIGIYAYRKSFLEIFCNTKPTEIERFEGLEQLRALYIGAKIKVVPINIKTQGVDTPEDLIKVEDILRKRGHS